MIGPLSYVWFGLVVGVSFLATPVKFRAGSLTMPVALDVGRATFHAFGALELALSACLALVAVLARRDMRPQDWVLISVVVAAVLIQKAILIPRLDLRVEAIIAGRPVADSQLHLVYIAVEALKAAALLTVGLWTARQL